MKISILLDPNPTQLIMDTMNMIYRSLDNATVDDFEILVPTSKLTYKSAEFFLRWRNVRLIDLPENSSRAHFWNAASKYVSSDSDYILLLDLRVLLRDSTIKNMLDMVEKDPMTGAVSAIYNKSIYGLLIAGVQENVSIEEWNRIADYHENNYMYSRATRMYLEGFCMMIRKNVVDEVQSKFGMLADETFDRSQLDDVDLSMKILQCGYKLKAAAAFCFITTDYNDEILNRDVDAAEINFKKIYGFSIFYSSFVRYDLLDLIKDVDREGVKILDVGCAAGSNLAILRDWNPTAKLFGIEINTHAAKIASCIANVVGADVETMPLDEKDFDYIICADVIEHLRDPWTALKNLREMLKPGGHLIASLPNVMYIDNMDKLLHGHWDYEDAGILDRTHLRFFTADSIRKIFAQENFTISKMYNVSFGLSDEHQKLAEKLSDMFDIDIENFYSFQYYVDAVK